MEKLKAALSNREYQIITDCAQSNISETPRIVPPLNHYSMTSSVDVEEDITPQEPDGIESQSASGGAWVMMKVSVVIDLVELCLHAGVARDASLATVQVVSQFGGFLNCWEFITVFVYSLFRRLNSLRWHWFYASQEFFLLD